MIRELTKISTYLQLKTISEKIADTSDVSFYSILRFVEKFDFHKVYKINFFLVILLYCLPERSKFFKKKFSLEGLEHKVTCVKFFVTRTTEVRRRT